MRWEVVELDDAVHVVPAGDDGGRFFHQAAAECLCEPVVAQYRVPLVVHRALTEHPHRRYRLRAWNLRRELRGKHAARWMR